ncbi:MAG: LPXTG cell wall anchor domain-containing protein [Clostridia bacterium]|nr:LPXTG cell wall anchor domain-containing protein [Clostridia bacterium]
MKNIKIIAVSLLTMFVLLMLSSSVFAGNISTVNATPSKNKVTVSGKANVDVLAVAILVYSDENLIYMETCNVDNNQNYSCELNYSFADGTYSIRVADYNGGNYMNTTVTVKAKETTIENETNKNETTENQVTNNTSENIIEDNTQTSNDNTSNPKTGDNIVLYFVILAIALLGAFGIIIKKKKLDKVNKH